MMNSQDNQQYITPARDNMDVINKGLIDIKSIQSDIDLYLKKLHEKWIAFIPFRCYIINEKR